MSRPKQLLCNSERGDTVEIAFEPRFEVGERVIARSMVRNDGTFFGKSIGEVIVNKGDIGYVTRIDTFLQRFYIYAVHFVADDRRVGMRARELCTLDYLNEGVCAPIRDHIAGPPSITDGGIFDGAVLNSKGGVDR
ncbi:MULTISPECIES: nitrogen fixation protein NifZ [Cupriavidus]|uniref:NifZ nitrogen fixation protein n=3 Tax=Cupriavidus TaxID=106589 RepID=A0A375CMU5_9BURK|nr:MULTISPECIES: nitrogen fixation protein NifZ [Cupriavidus]CAP64041.1 nifZ nitrogen fixation protein [Cupriavidus taiwanensis LMG 19424]SOY74980.1 nifZ nitrogen fixation protein [Cupriavidus taiwanensis]SOY74991.1 nifZ nitrogen fixation protein [Cupriavidus taiwanensis]SOY74992.1 nifZ nitrogen fixation protein [Cupriavidus taiwanensis]SOY75810.1 nifZ nitrogen fixation protein [Cupriavidus taiwanensis]